MGRDETGGNRLTYRQTVGEAFQRGRGIGPGRMILYISPLEKVNPQTKNVRRSVPMLDLRMYQWESGGLTRLK